MWPIALDTASTERPAALPQPVFQLGEQLLDRVEIGRVFRQEEQLGADRADDPADCLAAVAAEIVDDDEVVGTQCRQQHFLDVEPEAFAIDRTVDQPWRLDTIEPQRGEESHGLPSPMRHLGLQPLAAWRPTAQRRHIGLGPGLVDEHQVLRIDAMAIAQPLRTATRDIGAILFAGDQRLFL